MAGYCPLCGQVMVIGAELLSGDTRMPGLIFHRGCYELARINEKPVYVYPSLNEMPVNPDEPIEIRPPLVEPTMPPLTRVFDNGNKIDDNDCSGG